MRRILLFCIVLSARAQDAPLPPIEQEPWNLFYQATSIGQYHGTFRSPYDGPLSLQNRTEADVSLTTTLYFGLRLAKSTQFYFDPEVAGGRGFSGVNGIANFVNGELPRIAAATPTPYIARLYISQDFGFGPDKQTLTSDQNQLGGTRPMTRYSIYAGRFSLTDFFDNNKYTHDPRTQFIGWAVMYAGSWDYPADTRGYTWGIVNEFHTRSWSARYAAAAEPRVANGLRFDRRLFRNRGDTFEEEIDYSPGGRDGAIRFMEYLNHTRSGTYADAIRLADQTGGVPEVTATRRVGNLKYGFGINIEQALANDIGVFTRLGWNDGKTESFAFTAMDRLASSGISIKGDRWHRPVDTAAAALTVGGLSGVHAVYLARGGLDFNIGDGKLNYGPEMTFESYYSAQVVPWFWVTFDIQHITNPAYNRDRGPVWVPSLRLHIGVRVDTWFHKP
jgi:high affinity Mn2+ porin